MQRLNFPEYEFKLREAEGRVQIFDSIRKKYIALTPEEWVRQHLLTFLVKEKKYPASLIAFEISLNRGNKKQRADVVVFANDGNPKLIAECKAPDVKIAQETFFQIARYNAPLKMNYLVVSNGINHYCCKMDYENGKHLFMEEIPSYEEIR